MLGLGLGLLWASYSVGAYGWSQLQGCDAGFVDLIWPGRYKGCQSAAASGPPPKVNVTKNGVTPSTGTVPGTGGGNNTGVSGGGPF